MYRIYTFAYITHSSPAMSQLTFPFGQILGVCDNFRLPNTAHSTVGELVTWRLTPEDGSPAIGLLRRPVVEQLLHETAFIHRTHNRKQVISFAHHVNTPAARSQVMKELCERWRDQGLWPDVIGPNKWRNEMYPIYRDPFGSHDAPTEADETANDKDDSRNYAFMMERAACALFGTVTYGVHMSVYEEDCDDEGVPTACRMWIPTRSKSKQTWPGWLDNSVAGGIPSGLGAFESLVKESMEEASIEENIIRKYARAVGSLSYFFRYVVTALLVYNLPSTMSFRSPLGWLQPEVEYV